jgi:hypothetical protein
LYKLYDNGYIFGLFVRHTTSEVKQTLWVSETYFPNKFTKDGRTNLATPELRVSCLNSVLSVCHNTKLQTNARMWKYILFHAIEYWLRLKTLCHYPYVSIQRLASVQIPRDPCQSNR